MKRLFLYLFIGLASLTAKAQILDAWGLAVGATFGTHEWYPEVYNTQERYKWGFNGAGLVEFFHAKNFRWRVEAEFNMMGSKELVYSTFKNKTNYITLNNYLKIQTRWWKIMPYILIGPRIEYLLINKPRIYGNVIGAFPKFWFTVAGGVGFEWINRGQFRPFIEGFYNRDVLPSYHGNATLPYYTSDPGTPGAVFGTYTANTKVYYHGFEARIGFRYVLDNQNKKAKCPKVINPAGTW